MQDYSNFTDEQLAEWHQHVARIGRQEIKIAELTDALRVATNSNDAMADEILKAHATWRADFDRLSTENRDLADARQALRTRYNTLALVARDVFAMWLFMWRKGMVKTGNAHGSQFAKQVEQLLNGLIEEVP